MAQLKALVRAGKRTLFWQEKVLVQYWVPQIKAIFVISQGIDHVLIVYMQKTMTTELGGGFMYSALIIMDKTKQKENVIYNNTVTEMHENLYI